MIKDEKNFLYKEGMFGGREAILVNPSHSDDGWTKDNLFNRSAIYDKHTGEILSLSLAKFFNVGQSPDLYPNPEDYNDWVIENKLDGSLVAIDKIDGEILMRTRGAFCYTHQKNADDFKLIFEKYPNVQALMDRYPEYTMIFEIVTPNNRIVLHYEDVDFIFIGAIHKKNKITMPIDWLDYLAQRHFLKRPKKYDFKSLSDVATIVKEWRDKEGVVISYNGGANKVKLKADRYCFLHYVLSGYCNKNKQIDHYFDVGCDLSKIDYEIYTTLKKDFDAIDEKYKKMYGELVEKRTCLMNTFEDRKSYAIEVTR